MSIKCYDEKFKYVDEFLIDTYKKDEKRASLADFDIESNEFFSFEISNQVR